MDPRSAAHALTRIAALLELRGESRFKTRAYATAARAVAALDTDDLRPLLRDGSLESVPGVGPATLAVLRDLATTGESALLERLLDDTPEGLLELLRIPGLGAAKIHALHERLGVASVHDLAEAAADGRLTTVPGFGEKTAERVLKGIAFYRQSGARVLYPRAAVEAARLLADVERHPDVAAAAVAGSVRRRREVVCDVDLVAALLGDPAAAAASFARGPAVREIARAEGGSVCVRYVDGTQLDLHCVAPERYAVALWRATGSAERVAEVAARLAARGLTLDGDELRDAAGRAVEVPDEAALYARAGLAFVVPELREGRGEVEAAAAGRLPGLIEPGDLRGVLHCHSTWSDGAASIADMADAARARGWSYLGVTDHSQYASYAGGLLPDAVRRQHDEIDALNAGWADAGDGFRLLKGIEADILPEGRLDYDDATLDRFDFVVASVHSRFGMPEAEMTARVCRAMDDPRLTVLGHPTGRLLLAREGYAIDMTAVLDKAAETGAAIELNADPHRLDLDWRLCREAKARGITIAIGPDAHSPAGLDNVAFGVGIARKGWLEPADVLNARSAEDVLAFARRRRGSTHAD
ncbi:DNA polymerase/3'-5' exonuclease PolX [Roseisolibacter sp. H3M3-2]|uniref:DNA polymerase/3'-5' exonuclease PolX n=1 Tax=Roseisolibacter sp. H3M3-2 TaxID=3031323 RepID=UPI0023DBABB2|nr:DNA polymerase/3'-5' exonuclease PolX [Roseisolibacter sp. H3M3-2]MDF1504273.1 DNA polymerase/3'-5' exonuclease PolX [Roseisolibacter sp. H3M3-2]